MHYNIPQHIQAGRFMTSRRNISEYLYSKNM